MQKIFTNTEPKQKDRFSSFINLQAAKSDTVKIATAYFTYEGITSSFFDESEVKLLVGMNSVVNINELRKLLIKDNVTVRYYYDKFHPKIYIFSSGYVVVGSSNYTRCGIGLINQANRECNIATDEIDIIKSVEAYFDELWDEGAYLHTEQLDEFEKIQQKLAIQEKETNEVVEQLRPILDLHQYKNDPEKEDIATYDEFRRHFKELSEIYSKKVGNLTKLPLKIEVDQFLSWIYEEYKEDPAGRIDNSTVRANNIANYIQMFSDSSSKDKFFNRTQDNAFITDDILSQPSIENLDEDTIRSICRSLHSFDDRVIEKFIDENGLEKIQKGFNYLLYGSDDIKIRLLRLLHGTNKIKYFQKARALEMLGWADNEYPIWNWRVHLSMSILGYNNFYRVKTEGLNDRSSNSKAQ